MSVFEIIGSVWNTSQLNPYREPRLVFIEAKLQFSEVVLNKDDLFLACDLKGREAKIHEKFDCANISVTCLHAKARFLKVKKTSIQFCFLRRAFLRSPAKILDIEDDE